MNISLNNQPDSRTRVVVVPNFCLEIHKLLRSQNPNYTFFLKKNGDGFVAIEQNYYQVEIQNRIGFGMFRPKRDQTQRQVWEKYNTNTGLLYSNYRFTNIRDHFSEDKKETNNYLYNNCDFIDCGQINIPQGQLSTNYIWGNCKNIALYIDMIDDDAFNNFYTCHFSYLESIAKVKNLTLQLNAVLIDELITNVPEIRIRDSQIGLFYHSHLNSKCDFSFENVIVKYNRLLFSRVIEDQILGYISTYKMLLNSYGLSSQLEPLEKYFHYFNSRKSMIDRILFAFSKAYWDWHGPLTAIVITIFIKIYILQNNEEIWRDHGMTLLPVFSPYNLYKSIILNSMSNTISLTKVFLGLTIEPLYIFSLFSLSTFIRRRFGFNRNKLIDTQV